MAEPVPTGSDGRPLVGQALSLWQAKQARLRIATSAAEDVEATARMLGALAARVTGLPAPDALAALGGHADALRVLRCAGHDPGPVRSSWDAQRPVQRQASRGPGWDTDPDHDPRVLAAITSGAHPAELAAVRQQVAAEYASRQDGRQDQAAVLWVTRSGEPVVDNSRSQQAPRQRSTPYPSPRR